MKWYPDSAFIINNWAYDAADGANLPQKIYDLQTVLILKLTSITKNNIA